LSEDLYEALSRTALLIEMDIFGPGADHRAIIDGLRATTARIITDRANIHSFAGQTALVTLYAQLAMMGLQIDLDVPAAELCSAQPPVLGTTLPAALLAYSADLLPGRQPRLSADPDVIFALGDTPAPPGAVRVSGTGWTAAVGTHLPAPRWRGITPAGAMGAAAAAAAEGLRAAVPRIAERLDRPVPADLRWRAHPSRQVNLDLSHYRVDGPVTLGEVDVISGGAITNAALYALLRMPEFTAAMRIIEPDLLALANLNRYALALRSMVGWAKTRALGSFSTPSITIIGSDEKFDEMTARHLAPIAQRLLVGVDHIPTRWAAQRAATGWTCIGATSHDFAMVSAHPPRTPCAGCAHPRDEDAPGEIPTISFISFWAGLIQALELAATSAARLPASARTTHIWPVGLENPRGIHQFSQAPSRRCPVGCRASTALLSA
jgi:hypothetical protein